NYALETFTNIIKENKIKNILDIGAGNGNKIKKIHKHFEEITIIEPDESMFNICKTTLKDIKNITYINNTFLNTNLNEKKFDIILCAYTLPFINSEKLNAFINKLYDTLKINGYLIILAPHSKSNKSFYRKTYIDYNKIKRKKIKKHKLKFSSLNKEHIIIEKVFSIQDLKKLFKKFSLSQFKVYHILNKNLIVDKFIFRDKFYNSLPFKHKFGENVYMLFQKK
ncbi:MAG: class I SAM-dependent methyltransferase, partial [Nanoarchaeota archaeon]